MQGHRRATAVVVVDLDAFRTIAVNCKLCLYVVSPLPSEGEDLCECVRVRIRKEVRGTRGQRGGAASCQRAYRPCAAEVLDLAKPEKLPSENRRQTCCTVFLLDSHVRGNDGTYCKAHPRRREGSHGFAPVRGFEMVTVRSGLTSSGHDRFICGFHFPIENRISFRPRL